MVSGRQRNLQLQRAAELHDQGRLAEAVGLYRSILENRHDDIRVLCLCARANREMGHVDAAGELMRTANRLAPDSVEVFSETGELAMVTGDLHTADQVFRQLTGKYPAERRFWLGRARVDERLGNWQSSIAAYRRAMAVAKINRVIQGALEDAIESAGEATVPKTLRLRLVNRLKKTPGTTWDDEVYRIAESTL